MNNPSKFDLNLNSLSHIIFRLSANPKQATNELYRDGFITVQQKDHLLYELRQATS